MSDDDKIVGHKTFATGEICPETGFPQLRHEPLTKREADAIWERAEAKQKERAERMPDEQSAINAMWDGYQRLKELGWNDAIYCPKDGSTFLVIEPGSTGIHTASYWGEWPDGGWHVADARDLWPSRPILFKPDPEHEWFQPDGIKWICCRNCGVVQRADGKNNPCKGRVRVGPRDAES